LKKKDRRCSAGWQSEWKKWWSKVDRWTFDG
jgi:hypothetical protein